MPLPLPCPTDEDQLRHARDWLSHIDAGRIGDNPPPPSPETIVRRLRNEAVVLGRPLPRPRGVAHALRGDGR